MAGQISQNADGTYTKSYSDTEIAIIQALQAEIEARVEGDQLLWVDTTSLSNRVNALETNSYNLADMQNAITANIARLDDHENRIDYLEQSVIIDAYSKVQMNAYLVAWKVEQIPHVFATPTSEMFENANLNELKMGYHHYLHADIQDPFDHHFPENTMRRYTINAYAASPKQAIFNIFFADRCVVLADNVELASYIDAGGNFGGTAKTLLVDLKEGWTKIQFLVANEVQQGGLVITSDLYEQADYLTNLDYMSGMITGDRIQAGAIESHHLSPNMDLVVRTIKATAVGIPAGMFGDPNGCGMIQIGDKTISKCKDEPFVFDDGIRVNGYIRVSQLLIDVDFIRAGAGILIDKIKDAETGFTKLYEIINDLKVNNGGGLIITGNGQEGYTFTNDLQLKVNANGGLSIEGNAVVGYMLTNTMRLSTHGGIEVTGNAQIGYYVKNIMPLTVSPGLKVDGNAWGPTGYHIKNQMGITTEGIIAEPIYVDVDGIESWHLINDTKIKALGGILVNKLKPGEFEIANTLEISGDHIEVQPTGSNILGYSKYHLINGTIIEPDLGIEVRKITNGHFIVKNTGVRSINAGTGIRTSQSTGDVTVYNNGVVSLTGSGDAYVSGSPGGNWNVDIDYDIQASGDIEAWKSGTTFHVKYSEPNIEGGTGIDVSRRGDTWYLEVTDAGTTPPPDSGDPSQEILSEYNPGSSVAIRSGYPAGYYYNSGSSYQQLYVFRYVPGADNPSVTLKFKGGKDPGGTFGVKFFVGSASEVLRTAYGSITAYSDGGAGTVEYTYDGSGDIGSEVTIRMELSPSSFAKFWSKSFS